MRGIDNPPNSCYNYTCSKNGSKTLGDEEKTARPPSTEREFKAEKLPSTARD